MTLGKAIKAMEDEVNNIPVIPHSKLHSAHLLGIEALKVVKLNQELWGKTEAFTLPGETEE